MSDVIIKINDQEFMFMNGSTCTRKIGSGTWMISNLPCNPITTYEFTDRSARVCYADPVTGRRWYAPLVSEPAWRPETEDIKP